MKTTTLRSLLIVKLLSLSIQIWALAQKEEEDHFIYNGFRGANLHFDGIANVHPNGLLQLTNTSKEQKGHAFYPLPLKFNSSSSPLARPFSFSTNFVFAIVPQYQNFGAHGIAFTISPSLDFTNATGAQYMGLLNSSNNGSSNHLVAIEFDTIANPEFGDINDNHVGINVNSMRSIASAPAPMQFIRGNPVQAWIDYKDEEKMLNVTIAAKGVSKPNQPLLSAPIDLSPILLNTMYVGFSSATGPMTSNHYVLGWSFNRSGRAQSLDLSKLPPIPRQRKSKDEVKFEIAVSLVAAVLMLAMISGTIYIVRRRKFAELHDDWERQYGPQRFSYGDLYKATKGFKIKELLGSGGFGQVYRGALPSSNKQVAVKKVSHDSKQGMKEFVAEIASMGRLRHRNLVQLFGYCRRRGELLLVYDYMPNGSLDSYLYSNEKPSLNWAQRYRILRGIASGLLYLHEEWEQVVLHRDVKASNVLLDADLNGRLGDFGLARLYDHGALPHTTHVVGTIGYLAPELTRTGKATTGTDVFAFGAFMLEVACGRRPVELVGLSEEIVLVERVLESWKEGTILEMSDPRLEGDYVAEEMELVLKLGLLCSHSDPQARPGMRQVMQYLDGDSIFPEAFLDGPMSVGVVSFNNNEASAQFIMSFPSSFGSDSLLFTGR